MAFNRRNYLKQYLCSASRSTPTEEGPDDTVECIIGPKVLTSFTNNSNETPKCLHIFDSSHSDGTQRTWISQKLVPILIDPYNARKTSKSLTKVIAKRYLSVLLSRRSVTTGKIEVHKSSVIVSLFSIRTLAISAETCN